MKRSLGGLRLVLSLVIALAGTWSALWAGDAVATAVLFKKSPKIDGKLADGEWDRAVRCGPLVKWKYLPFEVRHAVGWMGWDKENLYVAVQSELRPGGLKAKVEFDDGRVVFDSGIEIWIDPNRDNRKRGKGDLAYYQLIGNSIGTTKDVKFGLGAPDTGWSSEVTFANHVDEEAGTWTAELRFPWKALGWEDGAASGRSIGLVISRNYKDPWTQPTWMPLGNAFSSIGDYPLVRLTDDDPVVRIEQMRHDTFMGKTPLHVKVLNPGDKPRKVTVDLLITSTDMPKIEKSETLDLAPGVSGLFTHAISEGRLHARATHTFNLVARDAESDEVLFRHKGAKWEKAPEKLWHVRTGPNPAAAAKVGYYPSYRLLRVWLRPVELGKAFADTREARLVVAGEAGETVLDKVYRWDGDGEEGVVDYTLPNLVEGRYTVTVTIPGFDKPLVRHFEDRSFPWEDNALGITTRLFPPFEPIVQEGNSVSVVMRKHKLTGLGLWESVQARGNESDYKELLAGPMRVKLSMDSDALDGDGTIVEGEGTFKTVQEHQVVYEGEARHPAVEIHTRTLTEYDGCMRVEMDLLPGETPQEIQHLFVDIPVRDEMAPLYHVSTTALRYNPSGRTPEGDGMIWDTRDFPDGDWPTGFRPYIWLGAEERGLCWFADNDKNWVKDVDFKKGNYDPAFSLHRKDGVLTLRIHLVQRPVTLKRKRHIVFGVMATPAKPMREDWRAVGRPDHRGFTFNMAHGFGVYGNYASKYPVNYDWSRFDHSYALRTGDREAVRRTAELVKTWYQRNVAEPGITHPMVTRLDNLDFSRRNPGDNEYSVYFEEFHSTWVKAGEEAPAYYTEWSGRPLSEAYFTNPPDIIKMGTGALVESFRDFGCWYAAEWLSRGFGIYFDNAFPKRVADPVTTAAYEWKGRIIPSASMWNHRTYLKRIWILHQQLRNPKAPQAMMIHMTNTHIAPYMVWNEYNLDFEWRRSDDLLQKRFSPDIIRTEALGLKTGNIPVVLGFSGGPAMLVHEVKGGISVQKCPKPFVDFGYGLEDCQVYNYWGDNPPLSVSDPDCKWLLLKRDGKLLIYLVTWNGDAAEVDLSLDTETLGLNLSEVKKAKTGEPVTKLVDGSFTVPVKGFGVRTLIVE